MDTLAEGLKAFRHKHTPQSFNLHNKHWRYYRCGQQSETLVIIHGAGVNAESLFPQITYLEKHFTIIVPDLPDFVESVQEAAEDIMRILEKERIGNFHLFGISMGGMIAQRMAHTYPGRIEKLILSQSCLPHYLLGKKLRNILRVAPWIPEGLLLKIAVYQMLVNVGKDTPDTDTVTLRFWGQYLKELYGKKFSRKDMITRLKISTSFIHTEIVTAEQMRGAVQQLMLIEVGSDRVFLANDRQAIKQNYPHAKVVMINPHYGHTACLLQPLLYAENVKIFLLE